MVPIKMHFFKYLANVLNTYLITYQTSNSMILTISDEIGTILRMILKIVILRKTV